MNYIQKISQTAYICGWTANIEAMNENSRTITWYHSNSLSGGLPHFHWCAIMLSFMLLQQSINLLLCQEKYFQFCKVKEGQQLMRAREREWGLHFSWYPRCCLMLRQHFNAGLTDAAFRTPPARLENVPGTVWSLCLTQNPPQNKIHMLFLLFLIVYMLNYFFQSWEKGSRWTLDVAERHVPVMLHRRWMGYWLCVLKRQL